MCQDQVAQLFGNIKSPSQCHLCTQVYAERERKRETENREKGRNRRIGGAVGGEGDLTLSHKVTFTQF